jgi:hypothetical protein
MRRDMIKFLLGFWLVVAVFVGTLLNAPSWLPLLDKVAVAMR